MIRYKVVKMYLRFKRITPMTIEEGSKFIPHL